MIFMANSEKLNLSVSNEELQRRVPLLRQQNIARNYEAANRELVLHNQKLAAINAGSGEDIDAVRAKLKNESLEKHHNEANITVSKPEPVFEGSPVLVNPADGDPELLIEDIIVKMEGYFKLYDDEIQKIIGGDHNLWSLSKDGSYRISPDGVQVPAKLYGLAHKLKAGRNRAELVDAVLSQSTDQREVAMKQMQDLFIEVIKAGKIELPYKSKDEYDLAKTIYQRRVGSLTKNGSFLSPEEMKQLAREASTAAAREKLAGMQRASKRQAELVTEMNKILGGNINTSWFSWKGITFHASEAATWFMGENSEGGFRETCAYSVLINRVNKFANGINSSIAPDVETAIRVHSGFSELRKVKLDVQIEAQNSSIEEILKKLPNTREADDLAKAVGELREAAQNYIAQKAGLAMTEAELTFQAQNPLSNADIKGAYDVKLELEEFLNTAKAQALMQQISETTNAALGAISDIIQVQTERLMLLMVERGKEQVSTINLFRLASQLSTVVENHFIRIAHAKELAHNAAIDLSEVSALIETIEKLNPDHPSLDDLNSRLESMLLALSEEAERHNHIRQHFGRDAKSGAVVPITQKLLDRQPPEVVVSVVGAIRRSTEVFASSSGGSKKKR